MHKHPLYLVCLLVLAFLTACADTRGKGEMWSYGKFCGPDEPHLDSTTKEGLLEEIMAFGDGEDDIDRACREHDICYIKNGYFNVQCDKRLLETLKEMRFRGKYAGQCHNVKLQVETYFGYVAPSTDAGHILATPVRAGLLPLTALPHGLMILSNGEDTPEKVGKCNSVPLHY